jgi:hypothetical protein
MKICYLADAGSIHTQRWATQYRAQQTKPGSAFYDMGPILASAHALLGGRMAVACGGGSFKRVDVAMAAGVGRALSAAFSGRDRAYLHRGATDRGSQYGREIAFSRERSS